MYSALYSDRLLMFLLQIVNYAYILCGVGQNYIGPPSEEERKIPLLSEVFQQFPNIPINIDIKVDDDKLIHEVSELVKAYSREHLTVWGNFSKTVTEKCYAEVSIYCLPIYVFSLIKFFLYLYTECD